MTIPYVSRILGVENIGRVNFSISYANSFLIFACLGIPVYGLTAIAKVKDDFDKRSKIFSEIFLLNVICSLIVSIIYAASLCYVDSLRQEITLLLISGLSIFFSFFSVDWYYSGIQKFKAITARSIATKIVSFCGIFMFVRDRSSLVAYLILFISSTFIGNSWNLYQIMSKEVKFRITFDFKHHLKPIFLLFCATLAATIYTMIDSILLGFLSTFSEVGYYTSCLKIVRIFMQVTISAGVVILPAISSAVGEADFAKVNYLLEKGFAFASFFVVPITLGLALIADPFVPLFFGQEFRAAVPTMRLLSFVVLFVGIGHTFGSQILIGFSKNTQLLTATIFGLIINLGLNWVLIPHLGAVGAAVTNIMTELVVLFITIYYSYKIKTISIQWGLLLKAIISCLPFCVIYFSFDFISWPSLFVFICISSILYILAQLLFKNPLLLQYFGKLKNFLNFQDNRL